MAEMAALAAIKKYFEMTMDEAKVEIKALSKEERRELGQLCCDALGVTLRK